MSGQFTDFANMRSLNLCFSIFYDKLKNTKFAYWVGLISSLYINIKIEITDKPGWYCDKK